ncbi:hypothetical protein JOB18_031319 [Solea senegalensis]|uniref:Secreted protein n=1 Tax=Solea senegalensis TaxID=28829 RepID=A0AAV6SV78_SOLSE|nr:hypothetical protein JOB18_031319 [Solea senegalensis]
MAASMAASEQMCDLLVDFLLFHLLQLLRHSDPWCSTCCCVSERLVADFSQGCMVKVRDECTHPGGVGGAPERRGEVRRGEGDGRGWVNERVSVGETETSSVEETE